MSFLDTFRQVESLFSAVSQANLYAYAISQKAYAPKIQEIQALLEKHKDLVNVEHNGTTLLGISKHPKITNKLLQLGADVNKMTRNDTTVFMEFLLNFYDTEPELACLRMMMSPPYKGVPTPDLSLKDLQNGSVPIHHVRSVAELEILLAPFKGDAEAIRSYVNSATMVDHTVLVYLTSMLLSKNVERASKLVTMRQKLIDMELKHLDKSGKAYKKGVEDYHAKFAMINTPMITPEIFQRLIAEGVNVGASHSSAGNPLTVLLRHQLIEIPVNVMKDQEELIHVGIQSVQLVPAIARILTEAGADWKQPDSDGKAAMDWLRDAYELVILSEKGKINLNKIRRYPPAFREATNAVIKEMYEEYIHRCEVCGARDSDAVKLMKCGGCKAVWYCGEEHRNEDWPTHKAWCREHAALKAKKGGRRTRRRGRKSHGGRRSTRTCPPSYRCT
jgi:hypothetical protein